MGFGGVICWFWSLVVGPRGLTVGKLMSCSCSTVLVFVSVFSATFEERLRVDSDNKYTRPDFDPFHSRKRFSQATTMPAASRDRTDASGTRGGPRKAEPIARLFVSCALQHAPRMVG